jgi:hypothetical protein
MHPGIAIISGAGLGAATMYLLDPDRGRRRRALMQDQAAKARRTIGEAADATARDVRNRSIGLFREIESWFTGRQVDEADEAVLSRVRSNLGMVLRHPRSVEVSVHQGHVTLHGPILEDEVDETLRIVSRIPGVRHVENRLEVHEQSNGIPGLQGLSDTPPRRPQFEWMQVHWSPTARLCAAVAGGVLAAVGLRRRGLMGTGIAALGVGFLTRGLTNQEFARLFRQGGGRAASGDKMATRQHANEAIEGEHASHRSVW